MNYEELLSRAEERVDRTDNITERYDIPEADILAQGNSTIITNYGDLVKSFRREPSHLYKFLLKELAVPGELKKGRLTLQGKFNESQVKKKIDLYVNTYVICPSCGKPDTALKSEGSLTKMECEACKAKHTVKSIK